MRISAVLSTTVSVPLRGEVILNNTTGVSQKDTVRVGFRPLAG